MIRKMLLFFYEYEESDVPEIIFGLSSYRNCKGIQALETY